MTLAEVTVVVVLAGVITLGLVGFYLNSQATWMDAASQALAQRDATVILESITDHARQAAAIDTVNTGAYTVLTLYKAGMTEPYSFWWRQDSDSLLHQGAGTGGTDEGPVVPSIVERFHFEKDPALPLLHIRMLEVRSAQGERVQISTSIALYNGSTP